MFRGDSFYTTHQGHVSGLVNFAFHIVCESIVVCEPSQFCVVGQYDFDIACEGQSGTMARAEGVVVAPALAIDEPDNPFPWYVKLQPIPQPSADDWTSGKDRPMGIAVGIRANVVSEETRSDRSLADSAFLVGGGQFQGVGQELPDVRHGLSRFRLAANNTYEKIIGITTVAKPLVLRIESIGCRNGHAFRFQPANFIHHG